MMSPKKRSPGQGGYYWIPSKKLYRRVWDNGTWPDGRRRTKEFTGRTKTIVNEKYDKWLEQKARNIESPDTTVAEWAEHWLVNVQKPSMMPNGLKSYESIARTWIIPTLGTKKVSALKASDVAALMKVVRDAGKSTATMRKVYNVLSQMVEAARRDRLTDRNIVEDVKPPRVTAKERGALSPAEALAVLRATENDVDGSKWWVTLMTGLRQGERLGARIDSLDLDRGIMRVEWTLTEVTSEHGCGDATGGLWPCGKTRGGSCPQRRLKLPDGFEHMPLGGRLVLKRPKSGKPRNVQLVQPLVGKLRTYLDESAHVPNPHGLLWRHGDGSPFLPGEDEQAWRELLFRAGVITAEQAKEPRHRKPSTPEIPTTHWGRHTAATVMMELGVDPKVIQGSTGWSSQKMMEHYQHVSEDYARREIGKVGEHYTRALESPQSGGQ